VAWGRHDITFDWNGHYLLNSFPCSTRLGMGIVRYCAPAPVGKKKKEITSKCKGGRRKVNMKGEHKVELSWSSSSLSTTWASPSKANRFPSFFSESEYVSRGFDSS